MTNSIHTYRAALIGAPDVDLGIVKGGRVRLDSSSAPHVQGTLILDDLEHTTVLDPRQRLRIRLDVSATFLNDASEQERSFDLCLISRGRGQSGAEHTLQVASDEALLDDWRALTDDTTPFSLASSLRSIVDYVLGLAIPGAVLESGPDANLTPYWAMTNQVTNPVAAFNSSTGQTTAQTGAVPNLSRIGSSGAPVGAGTAFRATLAANIGSGYYGVGVGTMSVRAGEVYTASVYARHNVGTARNGRAVIRWLSADGTLLKVSGSALASYASNTWHRLSVTAEAPIGADRAQVQVRFFDSASSGNYVDGTGFMLTEGPRLVPYFDGGSVQAGYLTAFDDETHASPSTRTPFPIERDPDALTIRAGQSALEFLAPLVQAAGYRLVCDEQRRWTLRDADYTVSGAFTIRTAINLIDGEDLIDRASDWFDAAVVEYLWTDRNGRERRRIDSFALPGASRVQHFQRNSAYPGPGFAEYAVRRAQGRGRRTSATKVSDWRVHADQAGTLILSSAPTLTGTAQAVEYNLDNDTMTIDARTVDTPETAWLLIPAGERWQDSPVGASWEEEM